MYAGRIACCPESRWVCRRDRQTDGRTPDRYITLSGRRGQHNDSTIGLRRHRCDWTEVKWISKCYENVKNVNCQYSSVQFGHNVRTFASVCLSVCLSVYPSNVDIVSKRLNRWSWFFWHRSYPRLSLHCDGKEIGYVQNKGTSLWIFVPKNGNWKSAAVSVGNHCGMILLLYAFLFFIFFCVF